MSDELKFNYTAFDQLLDPKGPVMLVGRQLLKTASIDPEDATNIVFPPSYANPSEKKDDPPVYNIDVLDPANPSKNVCVLDSVPSQANRMEPLFGLPEYSALVPQYYVKLTDDSPPVSILQVGHRVADAVFRGTTLRARIIQAFKDYSKGNAASLAKIGPTSLVFGAWDSRGTGVKVPRLVNSIIRAFNVAQLKRSAQYSPPIKYEQEGLIPAGLEGKPADHGLADVPSTHQIGGVQIHGEIRRDFSLNLELLRRLAGPPAESAVKSQTEKPQVDVNLELRRYILALALLAFTATQESTLRQGCQLLPKNKPNWKQFAANGDEVEWNPGDLDIPGFAAAAARDFGVTQPNSQPLAFDKSLLKASIDADAKKKADKKAANEEAPIEALRRLVDGLDFKGKDGKKQFKANASHKNLGPKLDEIAADATATDELRAIASAIKELFTDAVGADDRKQRMVALFPAAAAEATEESSSDAAQHSTEETPQ